MASISQEAFAGVLATIREGKGTDTDRDVIVKIGNRVASGHVKVLGKEVHISFGPESSPFEVFGLFSDDRISCVPRVTINEGAEKVIRAVLGKGESTSNPRAAAAKILQEKAAGNTKDFFNSSTGGDDDFFGDAGGGGKKADGSFFGGKDNTEMEEFLKNLPKTVGFRGKFDADKLSAGTYQILPNQAIEVLKILDIKYDEAISVLMDAWKSADTGMLKDSLTHAAAEAVSIKELWFEGALHDAISAAQQGRRNDYNYYGVMNVVIKGSMIMKGKGAVLTVTPAN